MVISDKSKKNINIIINYTTISKSFDNLIIDLQSNKKSRLLINNTLTLLKYKDFKLIRVIDNVKKLKLLSIKIITNINHVNNVAILLVHRLLRYASTSKRLFILYLIVILFRIIIRIIRFIKRALKKSSYSIIKIRYIYL